MRVPKWAIAVAIVVGVPFAAGVVQAAIPDAGTGEITVCYKPYTGFMRLVDTESVTACASDEKDLSWNQQGAPATKLWARVKADGTLVDKSGVTSVVADNHPGFAGFYTVTFTQEVLHCAAEVSPTSFNGGYPGNRVASTTTGLGAFLPTQVGVRTQRFDVNSFLNEQSDFNIAVFC